MHSNLQQVVDHLTVE